MTRTAALLTLAAAASFVAAPSAGAERPKRYTDIVKDDYTGDEFEIDMVLIPGGTFTMGSPPGEADRKKHEGPQVKVALKPFYMATKEVTFELFLVYYEETAQVTKSKKGKKAFQVNKNRPAVKRTTPKSVDAISGPTILYGDPTKGWGGGKRPVVGIAWKNARTFCTWLSVKTGKNYRLPTEAEWEFACRGGAKTAYSFGSDPDKLEPFAWLDGNSEEKTQEVGQKKPNPYGLYDMHGNVLEWVQDWYSPTIYAQYAQKGLVRNPLGPKKGEVHVARGGSYESAPEELRSAARTFKEEWWHDEDPQVPRSVWWLPEMTFIGMRVVRSIEDEK